jgi:hypothetical protein
MNATSLRESQNISDMVLSSTEERALTLLGQGLEPSVVASAVGVSESRISQLISNPHFSARVYELRYTQLAAHAKRDNAYDAIEDDLIEKLKHLMPLMYKPMEVLAAIRVINQAKRRGVGMQPTSQSSAPVVNLTLPIQIINQYRLDANNQVIQAGQQALITVQSTQLRNMLEARKGAQTQNEQLLTDSTESSARSGGAGTAEEIVAAK